jgi:hypothetical protein
MEVLAASKDLRAVNHCIIADSSRFIDGEGLGLLD